jgi:hypothetical protein
MNLMMRLRIEKFAPVQAANSGAFLDHHTTRMSGTRARSQPAQPDKIDPPRTRHPAGDCSCPRRMLRLPQRCWKERIWFW